MEDGPESVPAILHPRAGYVNYVVEEAGSGTHRGKNRKQAATKVAGRYLWNILSARGKLRKLRTLIAVKTSNRLSSESDQKKSAR